MLRAGYEGARQRARERRFEQHQAAGPGAESARHDRDEPLQHIGETLRLRLGVVQAEEGLRLALAHLVESALDRQERGQIQLLARRRMPSFEFLFHEGAELAQGIVHLSWRQVHLGQPAAVVFHLFQELFQGPQARRGPGRDGGERPNLRRAVTALAEQHAEAPVQASEGRLDGLLQLRDMPARGRGEDRIRHGRASQG